MTVGNKERTLLFEGVFNVGLTMLIVALKKKKNQNATVVTFLPTASGLDA